MQKYAVVVLTNSETPADRGRMVHAAHLTTDLREAGNEVRLIFCGQGVTWVPTFVAREHPFTQAYGQHFDQAQADILVCNMCAIRFEVKDAIAAQGFQIVGEGHDHLPLGELVQAGFQIISF